MRSELVEVHEQARPGTPDCSIVVPVFNGAAFLRESLPAVLGQTGLVCEILVSDDCSTDGSLDEILAIVRSYAGPHSVRVYRTSVPAVVDNMPLLAAASRSDCIIQAHQDDVSDPDRALVLRTRMKKGTMLVTSVARVRKDGRVTRPTPDALAKLDAGSSLKALIANGQGVIAGARYAMHRDLFRQFPALSGEHLSHGHDVLLFIRAKILGAMRIVRRPIITIGDHPARGSHQLFDRQDSSTRGFDFALRRVVILSVALKDLAHATAAGRLPEERSRKLEARLLESRQTFFDALVAHREQAIRRGFKLTWTKRADDREAVRSLPL